MCTGGFPNLFGDLVRAGTLFGDTANVLPAAVSVTFLREVLASVTSSWLQVGSDLFPSCFPWVVDLWKSAVAALRGTLVTAEIGLESAG